MVIGFVYFRSVALARVRDRRVWLVWVGGAGETVEDLAEISICPR
jgi:hypothetical protein